MSSGLSIYAKVYVPAAFVAGRTWRYVTSKLYRSSPTEMLESDLLVTPTTGPAAQSLVAGNVLGSVVPVLITLLGFLMVFSSVLVFVGRMDKVRLLARLCLGHADALPQAQGRNPALCRKAWFNGILKALGTAAVLAGDMFDLDGTLVVYLIAFAKCNQLRRRLRRTDFTWLCYVPFVLAAAILLYEVIRIALVVVPAVAPFVVPFFKYWFRPAIYAARLVFVWRRSIFSLAVYVVRLVVAYYPRFFWFMVSAARRLYALAQLASSLLVAFIASRR